MIQLTFLGAVLSLILAMKVVSSARAHGGEQSGRVGFWLSPLPSFSTWERRRRAEPALVHAPLRRCAGYGVLTVLGYGAYWAWVPGAGLSPVVLAYAAALPALCSGLALGTLLELALLPLGVVLPPLHGRVLGAAGVGEFWGRGWNRWVRDWYWEALFGPLRRSPGRAAGLTFLCSGVVHEAVINGTATLVLGTAPWGHILLYFLLQWAGLLAERRLPRRPGLRRAFTWLVVAGPAPLFLAEPMLRILLLWPQ